ncbi:MAG: DivIVA domain-containing protein, partial [Bacteroidota bacterium]
MNLSPLDIRRQQFTKAFRGYEPAEVEAFLKQVSDQVEGYQDEVRRAEERVRDAEAKLVHYEKVELALQEALESARETARQSEASAEERARLIIEEAELKAERILHDAEHERYGLRQDVATLNARQAEVAARLRGFLLSELEILAQFQGDDPVGFIKLQPAGGQGGQLPPASPPQLEAPATPAPEAVPEAPATEAATSGGDHAETAAPTPLPTPESFSPEPDAPPVASETASVDGEAAPEAEAPAPEEVPAPEAEPPPAPSDVPLTGAYTSAEEE